MRQIFIGMYCNLILTKEDKQQNMYNVQHNKKYTHRYETFNMTKDIKQPICLIIFHTTATQLKTIYFSKPSWEKNIAIQRQYLLCSELTVLL